MTHLTDEVVLGILCGPYFLEVFLVVWFILMRRRIKKLERRNDIEDLNWRRK
jgi:hypothetical protein